MVGERFYCRKFQANQFNKARCQNCFKSKDSHSDEALQSNKMTRNKTKFGYLYIAPENFDVTNASQKNRRWQRRWFVLYDDGELAYSLDQHPETVPQGIVDMTSCYDIRFADELTQNAYSLMVKMSDDRNLYFKADTSDEIRWWYEVLAVYPKRYMMQNGSSTPKMIKKEIAPPSDDEETALPSTANGTKTIIEVNLVVPNSRDRRQQQQRRVSDPWSQAKVDVSRVESLHHGTPRSVKNRKNSRQKDDSVVARSKTCIVGDHALVKDDTCPTSAATITQFKRNSSNDNNNNNSDSSDFGVKTASRNGGVDVRPSCSSSSKTTPSELLISTSALREIANNKADVDSSIHTLRKGWLMLKGRNETDWTKHWVVLSGFSLKLFKDAWAEDSGSSAVNVDLVHCEQVVPISVTRNYGIELRCKNCRYILSAMTPGIRDSWVSAIKQNVAGMTTSVAAVGSELIESSSDGLPTVQKQKRIAYVAPDSHSRCTTTDESCTEEDDDDNASLRSSSRADEGSMSESLFDSGRELASDEDAAGSGSSTPRRRRSLSPSVVRRSPVSRVKERNSSSRQHRSPASQRRDAINRSAELSSPASSISVTPSLIAAHVRLESVRNELQRTRDRLNATTEENEWLKTATNRVGSVDERPLSGQSQSVDDLDRLRRTLQEAERDILRKQDEIETLQRKLDFSVNELSGTENVLSASLVDLEKEREQFDRLSSKWNHRVVAMESQLRDTVKRLDRRERDTRDKSDQLKEMQTLQRRHEEMQRNVEILSRRLKEAEKMRYGGPGTEQRSTMMVHLEEKLAESEKKVAALSEKVHRLEESMDASDAAALTTTDKAKDESSLTAADTEAALETMRQMCREQSRRLLATLRNEAEFLQRLMSDKLSDLEASNLVVDADSNEIRDLLDDLNAVQQYLNEFDQMERDQQQSTSSKDAFHFKDVLNRLIELQEKLILLSRADNSRRTVRNENSQFVLVGEDENSNVKHLHERIQFLSNELHEARSLNGGAIAAASNSSGYCSDECDVGRPKYSARPLVSDSFVPVPSASEFLWDYPISLLHEDLSKSLSTFLREKLGELKACISQRPTLTSDEFASILIEAMSMEICLLVEISNLIEASSNDERLSCTVIFRDIRNTYVVLKSFETTLKSEEGESSPENLRLDDMSANFFHIYSKEMQQFLKSQWELYAASLPDDLAQRLRFNASSEESAVALRYVAEQLMSHSLFDDENASKSATPLSCFRGVVLKEEIGHLLARLQVHFEAKNSNNNSNNGNWDKNATLQLISKCFSEVEFLRRKLIKILDRAVSEMQTKYTAALEGPLVRDESFIDDIRMSIDSYLNKLKSNGTTARAPLTASGTKFVHLEKALSSELDSVRLLTVPLSKRSVDDISKILCLRGTVNGLFSWLDSLVKSFCAKFPEVQSMPAPKTVSPILAKTNFSVVSTGKLDANSLAPATIVGKYAEAVRSGLGVSKIADHYEPLTKQLLYQVCANASLKLSSAVMLCHYESKLKQCGILQQSCGQCDVLRNSLATLQSEKDAIKRRSLCDTVSPLLEPSGNNQSSMIRELRLEIAANEVKYESERRRIKEELQHWKERAEVGSNSTNLKNEVAELEQELVEVQNAHSEEIESLRASLQVDIDDMRQQLTNEQERRKKLANDMQNMKRLNDQSLDTIERNHSQLLEEIRNDHGDEVRRLIDDYEQQLQEEKEATRHALDALQKAHEHEMARQVQKARNEMSHVNHSGSISTSASSLMLPLSGDNWSRNKSHDFQDMLERMNKEICELSSAYSTKCLEASLLEDELDEAKIVLERINKTTSSDIAEQLGAILTEMKRAKNLQLQLCNVESELNACKHRIAQLEANFDRTKNTFDDLNGKIIPSTSIVVADVSLEPARYEAEIVYEREEETSPVAAEYTPKGVRARKVNPTSRRNDSRYYSSPNLERTDEAILAAAVRRHSLTPDSVLQELRTAMGLPVAERRKFFESLGKQSSM